MQLGLQFNLFFSLLAAAAALFLLELVITSRPLFVAVATLRAASNSRRRRRGGSARDEKSLQWSRASESHVGARDAVRTEASPGGARQLLVGGLVLEAEVTEVLSLGTAAAATSQHDGVSLSLEAPLPALGLAREQGRTGFEMT